MRFDAMVILASLFMGVITILYLPVFFALRKRGVSGWRQLSYLLLTWSFLLILFVTIFFMPFDTSHGHFINLRPFYWLFDDRITPITLFESIGNVLMFVPLGFLIPVVFKRVRRFVLVVLIVFIISFSIEFIQYFIGRVADVDDLIVNVVGGMLGFGLFTTVNHVFINRIWWKKVKGVVLDVHN